MWVTEAGLPMTVWTLPSPQVISQALIVSVPGSLDVRFNVYMAPSLTDARPLTLSVGATSVTLIVCETVPLPPSSSLAVSRIS